MVLALFMVRDDSFLNSVPEQHRYLFRDFETEKMAPKKIPALKEEIKSKFPVKT